MSDEHLAAIMTALEQVKPYQPQAVRLLIEQRQQTGQHWPMIDNRAALVRATVELREYAIAVNNLAENLERLSPVPLRHSTPDIEAYSL